MRELDTELERVHEIELDTELEGKLEIELEC